MMKDNPNNSNNSNNMKNHNLKDSNNNINNNKKPDSPKVSVALQYEPGDVAPKILATGRGHIADQIIEKAKETDVPVYEDAKLAKTLSKLEIGDVIPPELYTVVAEILVFVDRMDRIKEKLKK